MAAAGFLILGAVTVMAVAAPLLAPYDPLATSLEGALRGPSGEHLFGQDKLGRDVFSQVIHGARSSVLVALALALLSLAAITPWTADEETYLRAPFTGIVAEINGEIGEYVTPSPPGVATPPAVDLIDYSCLYITAPIDEVDAGALRVGLPARLSLDAFRGEYFSGRLSRIAPYVLDLQKQARTVEIDVVFDDPAVRERLLVGYSADIEVVLAEHAQVLRIPTEAVLEGNRLLIYLPATGTLEERQIKTGLHNWKFTEVVEGVAEGEQVVVSVDRDGVEHGARAVIDATVTADD